MFVRAMNGDMYPLSQVDLISQKAAPNNTIDGYAKIRGVGRVRLHHGEYERLFYESTIIPASSGYKTLERFVDGDNTEVIENPVIAWSITTDGSVVPVTLEGVDGGGPGWEALLTPEGRIVDKEGINEINRDVFYKTSE